MFGRGGWTLAATLTLAVLLSGCTSAAAATAKAEESNATNHAQDDWADDAELGAIIGAEGSWGDWESSPFSGDEATAAAYFERAEGDENVGDGRCEVWAYAFLADSKPDEIFIVVVDRDGEVLGTETEEGDDEMQPVGNWEVNSDDALGIAKDSNEGLREGLDSENFGVFMGLARQAGQTHAMWIVAGGGGGSQDFGDGGMVIIDAVTGDVIFDSGSFGDGFGEGTN